MPRPRRQCRPSSLADGPWRGDGPRPPPGRWQPSPPSRRRPEPIPAARAQYARHLRPAFPAWRLSSLAKIADLALVLVRIDGLRRLAAMIFVEHSSAASGVGGHLAARLHQIGLVLNHGGQVALRGAAQIPVVHVFVVGAVKGGPEIARPQPAGTRLGDQGRVVQPHGCELAWVGRAVWTHTADGGTPAAVRIARTSRK